eukprot:COSAG03_NODE_455_length_7769_cov_67.894263_6_plen_108_part_00
MLASTCTASCTGRWQERQHWVRLLASQHELPLLLAASKLAILQLAGGGAARGTHTHPAARARSLGRSGIVARAPRRAQVGVAAATADWPKRSRDMRYADQEDRGTAD